MLEELESAIKEVEEVNYVWCEDSSEIRSRFFTQLTNFYLLSIECREKAYNVSSNKELADRIKVFLKDERIWLYYFDMTKVPSVLKDMNFGR